jgi:rod shape-determining protein MreD
MIFMKDGWQETIWGTLGRLGLVLLVLLVLLLLSALPFNVGYAVDVRPVFILLAIYYWAVTRPETLNLPAVFFLGIFYDLLAGYPLGVEALTLVLVHWAFLRSAVSWSRSLSVPCGGWRARWSPSRLCCNG